MRIGIDLGGTKTEVIVLDDDGDELHRKRVPTPATRYDAIVQTIVDLVLDAERMVGERCSVGVGTPGALSRVTGGVKNSNTTCLNGRPLREDLERALARAVRLDNDANCFALSEATDGAGAGARVVFGVILGTGTGGGVVVDGKVIEGRNAIAGEWGHNPLPWPTDAERPGPACYCGKHGCIETFLSGPGLARDYLDATGRHAQPHEIAELSSIGQASARGAMERYCGRLARALASVVNVLDPDVIVLGGGVSRIATLYEDVPPALSRHAFSDHVDTPLLTAVHGDSSGVRGAAWLWPAARP